MSVIIFTQIIVSAFVETSQETDTRLSIMQIAAENIISVIGKVLLVVCSAQAHITAHITAP